MLHIYINNTEIIHIQIHDYYNTIMFDLRLFSESPSQKTIEIVIQRFMLKEQQYTDNLIGQTDTQHNNFDNIFKYLNTF